MMYIFFYNSHDNIFYIFYRVYLSCIFSNKFLLSFFKILVVFFIEFIYFSIIIISIIKLYIVYLGDFIIIY